MRGRTVFCLMGPTAAGKTDIAIRLAAEFPLDLVSVDSALVYRGMDIGTAKPEPAILESSPHALIDIRDPEESYSAGAFVRDATGEIDRSLGRQRFPLLVGGTMLYFRSLFGGLADLPVADEDVRRNIDEEAEAKGWPALHGELRAVDAASASKINPNDAQRIQRALEVFRISGRSLSEWQANGSKTPDYDFVKIALVPGVRAELHRRIEKRLDLMLELGVLDEVRTLMERPNLTAQHASMRSVGYRQFWAHLEGEYGLDEARAKALAATRQLAKRQLTWQRSETGFRSIDPLDPGAADATLQAVSREIGDAKN